MSFMNPNPGSIEYMSFGGAAHLLLIALLPIFVLVLILFRNTVARLRQNTVFMNSVAWFILAGEAVSYTTYFIYDFQPAFERIPLHLCGSLALLLPVLMLTRRYDILKFVSIWAIGAGFISIVNQGLGHYGPDTYFFWHYLWVHYFLFLMPTFLFISGEFSYDLRYYLKSISGLLIWSFIVFLINWAFDTNYMYSGRNNTMEVPFIPESLMIWPLNYVSYVVVALVLLTLVFFLLRANQHRFRPEQALFNPK